MKSFTVSFPAIVTATGPSLSAPSVRHGVSTRLGGVSQGRLASANLSFRVGDAPEAVRENRRRLCLALGFAPERLVAAQQVHGTHVAVIAAEDAGRGALDWETALPETDALISDVPGVPLIGLAADCAVAAFHDPVRGVVGVAHLGWRGAVGQLGARTVATLAERYGSRPSDLRVAIGPSIGACCYEVGPEVVEQFRAAFPETPDLFRPEPSPRPGHAYLHVRAGIRAQLLAAGVAENQLAFDGTCTACATDRYYSHRAERGRAGRFGVLIGLRETAHGAA